MTRKIYRLLFCLILFPESHFPSGPFVKTEIREGATRTKNTHDRWQYVAGSEKEKDFYVLQTASNSCAKVKESSYCSRHESIVRKKV